MLALAASAAALAPRKPPARVVISGGTHGNEYTGVYVLQRLALRRAELMASHPSLNVETLFANPRAHAENRRFIDYDLNREFSRERLADVALAGHEVTRARAINAQIGPKGTNASAAVCIDMHTTTANMGCTLIASAYSPVSVRACAYVHEHWEAECAADVAAASAALERCGGHAPTPRGAFAKAHPVRVLLETGEQADAGHVASVARHGVEIEVGPTPQGLLRADVVASTERALRLLLRYLELHYRGEVTPLPSTLPVYVDRGKVPFIDGEPSSRLPGAVVAASLQDRDFEPLRVGEPLFERMDGTIVPYDGSRGEVVHPVFINEAAYYYFESGRGVGMTQLKEWPVPHPPDHPVDVDRLG